MIKIYKLFGIKILEVEESEKKAPSKGLLNRFTKSKGGFLEYSQEEYDKDKEKETLNKMENK